MLEVPFLWMPLCLCKNTQRCISQAVLKSDQFRVAHNIYTTENILHYLRFPTLLKSQDALPKSSGGSHTVASCFRMRFYLYRDLYLNLWNKKLVNSNFFSSPNYEKIILKYTNCEKEDEKTIVPLPASVRFIKFKKKITEELNNVNSVPDIISFTVGFAIPNKARTGLVQILITLRTLQTRRMPFQIRRNPQNILIVNLIAAANT